MQLRPTNNRAVEGDEVLTFIAVARNLQDTFITGEDTFSVIVSDDDGMIIHFDMGPECLSLSLTQWTTFDFFQVWF